MGVIERARLYCQKLPEAIPGSGGHAATFRCASVLLWGFGLSKAEALQLLGEWNHSHCQQEKWSDSELVHKIESAAGKGPGDKPVGYLLNDDDERPAAGAPLARPVPKWPKRDHRKILELLRDHFVSLADLEDSSPVPPGDVTGQQRLLIDNLFLGDSANPDPWLCLARDVRTAATRRRSEWTEAATARARFIVPSAMTGPTGKTQDGRESVRCLSNTGRRRFLTIEADFTEAQDAPLFEVLSETGATVADLCATVLSKLAEFAPLVMAVHSGGKSLHGWFPVLDRSETDLRRFMRFACIYGADRATWTKCQLVRLPLATRDNGNLQSVHYLDVDRNLLAFPPRS